MSNIDKYSQKIFEDIRRMTDDGIEFWYGITTGIRIHRVEKF